MEGLVGHAVSRQLGSPPVRVYLGEAVLVRPDDDRVPGRDGGVLVEEVKRSEEESDRVSRGRCVGNVLRVGDMQEPHCYPGNQILQTGTSKQSD